MDNATIVLLAVSAYSFALIIVLMMISRQLRGLHDSTNSRLDQLLKTTGSLARAEGYRAGQEAGPGVGGPEDRLAGLREAGKNL